MCGLAGFMGAFDRAALQAAGIALAHRGPDDFGEEWMQEGPAGLSHRRLSIIDLSPLGHQPMWDATGTLCIAFNGEIYNFRQLRRELESAGCHFRSDSDTEVVLNLYLTNGAGMLSGLNGIFALAIWDKRDSSLFLARDALGVKPLYYAETTRGIGFASEIKALLQLVPEAHELDVASLHRYLTFLWCPGNGTPLNGVRKLLPGEAMIVRESKVVRRWTWHSLPGFRGVSRDLSTAEAIAGTADGLRQAVHRQLVADVPVGAFLSGGLDSSAVVTFAREQVRDIRCFTIESTDGEDRGVVNDLPYARKVAAHLGVSLDVVQIDSHRMANDVESMFYQLDEPLADPACLNVLYISGLARKYGIKVLLSGAGGDDLFAGYRRHRAVQWQLLWNWLPAWMRRGLEQSTAKLDQRIPLYRRMAKLFSGAGLCGDARLATYFAWAKESDLLNLYTSEFRAALGDEIAAQPMLDYLSRLSTTTTTLERLLALEQRFFLADHNLLYTDKMSMATGIEVRVPFLDLDLVEFAARIPSKLKQRGATGKWVLKKALEPYLPHDVIYRPKTGFGAPLRRWMRNELRPLLGDILSVDSLTRRGIFEPKAVQRLIANNDRGEVDGAYTLLSLLGIEIWCRAFLDGAYVGAESRGIRQAAGA